MCKYLPFIIIGCALSLIEVSIKIFLRQEMDDFYVTLPSNVKDIGLDNTMANFTTKLPKRLVLNGNWKVALTEIYYTKSWFCMKQDYVGGFYSKVTGAPSRFRIKAKYYASVDSFVKEINEVISEAWYKTDFPSGVKVDGKNTALGFPPKFTYDSDVQRVAMRLGIENTKLNTRSVPDIGPEAKAVLGFNKRFQFDNRSNDTYYAERFPSLSANLNSLMIYTDITRPSIVGDREVSLLRAIPVNKSIPHGENCDVTFSNPYYHPLSKPEISTISFNIKDDTGSYVPFSFGKLVVTLHFKKDGTILY